MQIHRFRLFTLKETQALAFKDIAKGAFAFLSVIIYIEKRFMCSPFKVQASLGQ